MKHAPDIDPFSVSKHSDIFPWVELRCRQKDSPDHFTNDSYEVSKIVCGFLPLTDRHMTRMQKISPNPLHCKTPPTADSKDFIGCFNHSIDFLHYATKNA